MKDIKDGKEIFPVFEPKTDPFGENVSGEQAYSRTERLVSAVYLVTNHVREDDPLRLRIRSIGHELLREVLELHGGFRAVSDPRLASILALVREGMSLTRLLQLAGYVSEPNVRILTNAFDELGQFLSLSQRSSLADGIQLDREDFIPAQKRAMALSEGRATDMGRMLDVARRKDVSTTENTAAVKATQRAPGRAVQTEVHSERRRIILHLLGKGGRLGIKDIAAQMVGCSEKTVQREISSLVRERLVKKEGEKRWSGYRLANT